MNSQPGGLNGEIKTWVCGKRQTSDSQKYPFHIPFIENGTPFTYVHPRSFETPLDTEMSVFSTLFYTSTREILTVLNAALKRYPFRAEPPRIVHYRENPPPPLPLHVKRPSARNCMLTTLCHPVLLGDRADDSEFVPE